MSTDELSASTKRLIEIFFPFTAKKLAEIKDKQTRFVHYTTADVAMSIIRNREVWMRNSKTMNDFMEIEHGFECLRQVWNGDLGKRFKHTLDSYFPGSAQELELRFDAWLPSIRRDTYLTCLSEHRDDEDRHGRLSMWRAYGGSTGVALVLNNDLFLSDSQVLNAYSSPVAYLDNESFPEEFSRVLDNIEKESQYVRELGKDSVFNVAFNMMHFAVLCTKHPGFREEHEWRVIYSPAINKSEHLVSSIESVSGTPQRIFKIPLRNIPDKGLVGMEIPELLNRIIIGPTQFPQAIYEAFETLLINAGIPNPEHKIVVSDIPLR